MNTTRLITVTAISASLVFGLAAQAQEETPVEMKDLPTPARNTVKQKIGNQQIIRIVRETENGKEFYDAVVNRNGKEVGYRVEPDGKFVTAHPENQGRY
jgi:hypothetical protein